MYLPSDLSRINHLTSHVSPAATAEPTNQSAVAPQSIRTAEILNKLRRRVLLLARSFSAPAQSSHKSSSVM